jgi:hypothetical protein
VLQLRLAQLGGVDLQGHLSKYNPDAAEQGIFTQDWELRYFVLSGNKTRTACRRCLHRQALLLFGRRVHASCHRL